MYMFRVSSVAQNIYKWNSLSFDNFYASTTDFLYHYLDTSLKSSIRLPTMSSIKLDIIKELYLFHLGFLIT